jgi:sulfite oxidase
MTVTFPQEREGWTGYVEWEKYPERKKEAQKIVTEKANAEV